MTVVTKELRTASSFLAVKVTCHSDNQVPSSGAMKSQACFCGKYLWRTNATRKEILKEEGREICYLGPVEGLFINPHRPDITI